MLKILGFIFSPHGKKKDRKADVCNNADDIKKNTAPVHAPFQDCHKDGKKTGNCPQDESRTPGVSGKEKQNKSQNHTDFYKDKKHIEQGSSNRKKENGS